MAKLFSLKTLGVALSFLTAAVLLSPPQAVAQSNQTAAAGVYNLLVTAVPVPGAAPMHEQIVYTVEALDGKDRGRVVASHTGPQLAAKLPSGRYRVTSVFNLSTISNDIEIKDAPVTHQMALNAGGITLALMPHFGAPEINADIEWTIWTFGRDATGNRWEVARARGANPRMMLPEGYYYVTANYNGAEARHTIEVTAGNNYNYAINLNAGTMRVYAEPAGGSDVTVFWKIYRKDTGGTGEPLMTSSSAGERFLLPEGDYLVVAQQGEKLVKKEFSVAPGKSQAVKMNF